MVSGDTGNDFVSGGPGDDTVISSDDKEIDKLDGGDGFDDCLISGGDELWFCEF